MKITYELNLENFGAWSGAVHTLNRVIDEGKTDILESVLNDLYPDGLDETALNDILWFDDEWIYEVCGIRTEAEIREELEEAREELEVLTEKFKEVVLEAIEEINENRASCECNKLTDEEAEVLVFPKVYKNYELDFKELKERIAELEEELENI